ncbi:L,D-transpeptidase [Nannocystis pusilla]|uniref:L,D-transpeptidase n=1 Tax=Nannocystis pusilla TaxID=889268 RepID=A0A9X3ERR0_9BACT|nr:L,D-transpeptidase [Nannocystis pusilla]MCY1005511.1 L,D-transpeptidase [Nannocystis pusilla]
MQLLVAWTVLRTFAALGRLEPVDEAREGIKVDAAPAAIVETHWPETGIRTRPWSPSKRIATMSKGTRLLVRGVVASRDSSGCKGKPWYAVYPFGYVCSEHVKPGREQPTVGHALGERMRGDRRLPYDYAKVREEGALMYRGVDGVRTGVAARSLSEGMNLAVARTLEVDGAAYVETVDGQLVSKSSVGWLGQGSAWHGVYIDASTAIGPAFAWSSRDKVPVLAEPAVKAAQVGTLGLRERVDLLEETGEADPDRWWKIGDGRYVQAKNLNEVVFTAIPEGALRDNRLASGDDQWIDVDLGEQVLVAYRGERPVYATLVSSGKGSPTPKGNYPIWAKVASMTMANQDYEDNPYMVEHVPGSCSSRATTRSTAPTGTTSSASGAATAASTSPRSTRGGCSSGSPRRCRPGGPATCPPTSSAASSSTSATPASRPTRPSFRSGRSARPTPRRKSAGRRRPTSAGPRLPLPRRRPSRPPLRPDSASDRRRLTVRRAPAYVPGHGSRPSLAPRAPPLCRSVAVRLQHRTRPHQGRGAGRGHHAALRPHPGPGLPGQRASQRHHPRRQQRHQFFAELQLRSHPDRPRS